MAELTSEQLKPAFTIEQFPTLSELEPIPFAALQPRAISGIKRLASFETLIAASNGKE